MEEYFAPHGTDHQILDGRESRMRDSLLLIGVGILGLALLLTVGWVFWWQRRVVFSVPHEALTLRTSNAGLQWLQTTETFPIPDAWRTGIRTSLGAVGGTIHEPTWMIVPRWIRPQAAWRIQEAHGLYHLLQYDAATTSTSFFTLRTPKEERLPLKHPFIQGLFYDGTSSVVFALNKGLLQTSLPQTAPTTPLHPSHEGSLLVASNPLSAFFLSHLEVGGQGLAPWRSDIERFSWSVASPSSSHELLFTHTSTALAQLLATSTITATRFLSDGTASPRIAPTANTSSISLVIGGSAPAVNAPACSHDRFVPFLRISGETLKHLWRPLSDTAPELLAIGSLDERLTVCFTPSSDVDK